MHFEFRFLCGILAAAFILSTTGCASGIQPTPLQIAAGAGDPDNRHRSRPDLQKVKALAEAGHDVNGTSGDVIGGTALHSAAQWGTPEIVNYLISRGARVNVQDKAGVTPLMTALRNSRSRSDSAAIAALLLEKGAEPNVAPNMMGLSPLTEAASAGRLDLIELLVKKGADISRDAGQAYIRAANGMSIRVRGSGGSKVTQDEQTNVEYQYIAVLEYLVSKGADVNTRMPLVGHNALHFAAILGNPKVVRYLLKAGVNPEVRTLNTNETPLEMARTLFGANLTPEREETIALLDPTAKTAAGAAGDTSAGADSSALGAVGNTLADCVKLKTAQRLCERLPWPASTGCNALAKAQFSNSVCRG